MKKLERKLLLTLGIISILLFISNQSVISQNIIAGDPSDTFDLQAVFVNPAVIPFHHRQVLFGMKLYQMGFLKNSQFGLRSSYFSFTLPQVFSGLLDVGFTGQNFSIQLYDQTNFSFQVAKQVFERVFIGTKYNLFTKSYHREYFDLEHDNDPVFADGTTKFAHSFGAGLVVFPWSHLALSFSCDHLNQPDISLLKENYRQPLMLDFGCRYSYGHFSSSLYFNNQQEFWQMNWILETRPTPTTIFKIGYVQNAAKFETQLYLFNGFSMNYIFDYPLYDVNQFSSGSHQISVVIDLGHRDKLKELPFTDFDEGKFPIFNLSSQFFVEIGCNNLEIVHRKIIRSVDDRIPGNALKRLTEVELAFGDSSNQFQNFYKHGTVQDENLPGLYNAAKYSKIYIEYLKQFIDNSALNSSSSIHLITNPNSISRAMDLRDSLITGYSFLDQQIDIKQSENDPITKGIEPLQLSQSSNTQSYFLHPDSVSFHISSLKMNRYRGFWKLIISDYSGHEVKIFAEKGNVHDKIVWDWRDEEGKFIKPGIYHYFLQWEDKNNQIMRSQPKTFTVTKIARTLEIDVRSKPEYQKDQVSKIEIKLSN